MNLKALTKEVRNAGSSLGNLCINYSKNLNVPLKVARNLSLSNSAKDLQTIIRDLRKIGLNLRAALRNDSESSLLDFITSIANLLEAAEKHVEEIKRQAEANEFRIDTRKSEKIKVAISTGVERMLSLIEEVSSVTRISRERVCMVELEKKGHIGINEEAKEDSSKKILSEKDITIELKKAGFSGEDMSDIYIANLLYEELIPFLKEYRNSGGTIGDLQRLNNLGFLTGSTLKYMTILAKSTRGNLNLIIEALISIISVGYLITNDNDMKEWTEFIIKNIRNNRRKAIILAKISRLRQYKELNLRHFVFYLMKSQPANLFNFIENIESLNLLKQPAFTEVRAMLQRTVYFVLSNRADNLNYIQKSIMPRADGYSLVEKLYVYLLKVQNKDVQKNLNKLRKVELQILDLIEKSAERGMSDMEYKRYIERIEKIDAALIREELNALETLLGIKVKEYFSSFLGISPDFVNLPLNADTQNALEVVEKAKDNEKQGKELLLAYNNKETYNFNKTENAYPFNLKRNIEFIKDMEAMKINIKQWIHGLSLDLKPVYTDALEQKIKTIDEYKKKAIILLNKLEIEANIENLSDVLDDKEVKEFLKQNSENEYVRDLKVQINYIASLEGEVRQITDLKKITIYTEQNPLKVLQMGNWVGGSCLSAKAGNAWSTIANAVDVNKKVLYAIDNDGNILGRKMIALTDDGAIIQFRTYNNFQNLNLDYLFEEFILQFSQRCHARLANSGQVRNLVSSKWYNDGVRRYEHIKIA